MAGTRTKESWNQCTGLSDGDASELWKLTPFAVDKYGREDQITAYN